MLRQPIRGSSAWATSATQLRISKSDSSSKSDTGSLDDTTPLLSWALNPIFATAWVALMVFSFGFAPGDLNDYSLLEKILADPVHPDINAAFYTLFNIFAPLPLVLAALVVPQGQPRRGLPAGPFVAGAAFLGFFALGPYLSLRAPPRDTLLRDADADEISWITRHLLENKILNWSTLALLLYLPWACGLLPNQWADPATWDGLWELLTTSRVACVSAVDLLLLHTTSAYLIVQDYQLRASSDNSSGNSISSSTNAETTTAKATKIAVAAFLVPFVGPALYCALRPQLPLLMDTE